MSKNKAIMLIASLSFLLFVGYKNYTLPIDSVLFSPEVLYRSTGKDMTIDPKDYYMKLNGLNVNKNSIDDYCQPSIISDNKSIPIGEITGNYLPITNDDNKKDYSKLIGFEGEGLFRNKDTIIMPISNSKFKNSNMLDSTLSNGSNGRHDIEIISGNKILIVIEDVMTWWCHAHNPSDSVQHDVKVGNKSNIKSVRGGAVIGIAKESTRIKVYKLKENINIKVDDVKDINNLEQIHAGEYIANNNTNGNK